MDPIDRVLEDLGRMRGKAFTEMVRLPAPDPFKKILREVDTILSRTETEILQSYFKFKGAMPQVGANA